MLSDRNYFKLFHYEQLTKYQSNKELIHTFSSKKMDNSLEQYLLDERRAWAEDEDGETRVYLVKDSQGNIPLYFSVKCGMLVGKGLEEDLEGSVKDLLDAIIDAKKKGDKDALTSYYTYGQDIYNDIDKLFRYADEKLELIEEASEIHQEGNTLKVPTCHSAIEIRHICKNENYLIPKHVKARLGFGIFWEVLVPLLEEITAKIGCRYIYLFAADKTENLESTETRRLVDYYKNYLKFYECYDDLKFVKPKYDNYCYGLIQEVSRLAENREAAWQEFSDTYQ